MRGCMVDMSSLAKKIALTRQEMIALSTKYGIDSPFVLEASERLDVLLNEYHKQNASTRNKHVAINMNSDSVWQV